MLAIRSFSPTSSFRRRGALEYARFYLGGAPIPGAGRKALRDLGLCGGEGTQLGAVQPGESATLDLPARGVELPP